MVTGDLRSPTLVLPAAASVALGSVVVQRIDANPPTVGTVAWSIALGGIVLHFVSLGLAGESLTSIEVTPVAVGAILYLVVSASAVGCMIYFDLLDRIGAIEINADSCVSAEVATLPCWIVLGEALNPLAVVGFTVKFSGFAVLKREPQ